MQFSYQYYKNFLLFGGLLTLIIGLVFLVFSIRLLRYVKPIFKFGRILFLFKFLIISCISIFLLIISLMNLRYGIHLVKENESDSIELVGFIDEINETWFIQGYYSEGGKVNCKIVIINQEKFLFVATDDLVIGDEIKIDYLPKSRVVLSYEKVFE